MSSHGRPELTPAQVIQPLSGTEESVWVSWQGAKDLPVVTPHLLAAGRPVVVLAAHPDDEVLGVGGLLSSLGALGTDVRLIWATDGEASHPGSTVDLAQPARLASVRREESAAALAALGLADAPRTHLGLPDGAVASHEDRLAEQLAELVPSGALVLAPWSGDAHPDHEACGRAARQAVGNAAPVNEQIPGQVVEYPIWTWHWATPDDVRVPWELARRVELDDTARQRKATAIDCFVSQVIALGPAHEDGPVLPDGVLAHFRRTYEVLLVTSGAHR